MARRHGIETLYILTEPGLANHFKRLGVQLEPIGPVIEHHGQRQPLMMKVEQTIHSMNMFIRPLYREIAEEIEAEYDTEFDYAA